MIPNTFGPDSEGALINFTFEDVATGFGIITLNAFSTEAEGVPTTKLNTIATDPFDSVPQGEIMDAIVQSFALTETVNFDSSPNNFLTRIKGLALVDFTFAVQNLSNTTKAYVICKVQVINSVGAVVATAGSTQSITETTTANANATAYTKLISIDCSETNIIPGNSLRLSLEVWTETAAGTTGKIVLAHDPANQDISISTVAITAADNHTYLKWYAPFKIDL